MVSHSSATSAIYINIDVSALNTNIPKTEGLQSMKDALNTRAFKTVPTEFLIQLLEIVLSQNIFEFNKLELLWGLSVLLHLQTFS